MLFRHPVVVIDGFIMVGYSNPGLRATNHLMQNACCLDTVIQHNVSVIEPRNRYTKAAQFWWTCTWEIIADVPDDNDCLASMATSERQMCIPKPAYEITLCRQEMYPSVSFPLAYEKNTLFWQSWMCLEFRILAPIFVLVANYGCDLELQNSSSKGSESWDLETSCLFVIS